MSKYLIPMALMCASCFGCGSGERCETRGLRKGYQGIPHMFLAMRPILSWRAWSLPSDSPSFDSAVASWVFQFSSCSFIDFLSSEFSEVTFSRLALRSLILCSKLAVELAISSFNWATSPVAREVLFWKNKEMHKVSQVTVKDLGALENTWKKG